MKQENLVRWKELLVIEMNHWVIYTIVLTCLGLSGDKRIGGWEWLLLSLLPYVFFLVRRYTDSFVLFILSHVGIGAAVLLLPVEPVIIRAAVAAVTVWYVARSGMLRLKSQDRLEHTIHPAAGVVCVAIGLMLQRYQAKKDWDMYYVAAVILFLGLYFIHYYLERYLRFLLVNGSSTCHIPEREIFRSGLVLSGLYSLFVMAALFITGNIAWLSRILKPIKDLIVWLLNMLPSGAPVEESIVEQNGGMNLPGDLPFFEETEPFFLWEVLEKIIFGAIMAGLAAAVILGIYKLVVFLWESFHKKTRIREDELAVIQDVREKCGIDHGKAEKKSFLGFLDPAQRIRKLYRKKILAEKEQLSGEAGPDELALMTARECGRRLNAAGMAEIYEKARYSGEECSAEDVKLMRGIVQASTIRHS